MLAVSNTSPLRYLIAVEQTSLLVQLFDTVLIPPAVFRELSHPAAPWPIRQWIDDHPAWLRIYPLAARPDTELTAFLDDGEAEAIQLTIEQKADVLILDEWKGRTLAQSRLLPITGALGVLGQAHRQGFLDDPLEVLAQMRQKGFRIHEQLVTKFQLLLHTRYAR